jgi:hypothetical protein
MPENETTPEQPLSVKLVDGYLEQLDRYGPDVVKTTQDFRQTCISVYGQVKKAVLDLSDKTGVKPPFINTLADIGAATLTAALDLECTIVESAIATNRQAAVSIRDSLAAAGSA